MTMESWNMTGLCGHISSSRSLLRNQLQHTCGYTINGKPSKAKKPIRCITKWGYKRSKLIKDSTGWDVRMWALVVFTG